MDNEFVNTYIERIIKEVEELTKVKLLNEAKIKYIEDANGRLVARVEELEKQIEKSSKRINKTKEVDTSETTF